MTEEVVKSVAKLTLLRAGCYNFRSCGRFSKEQPFHIIDFTKITNLLAVSQENGDGKSTLYKHLIDYCITGANSVKDDNLDALVNSANRKEGMRAFHEWHFAGNVYRCDRGRGKLECFDIFKQINGEWVEIPDLPVKGADRQALLYALMGLERSSAKDILEATVILGVEKFKSFLNLKTQERKDIFEPYFGLTIFSKLNEQAKSKRTGVILEQKQTGLEITDLNLKVALAEQATTHSAEDKNTLEVNWEAREAVLKEQVSNGKRELEEALKVDAGGAELNDVHNKAHYNLCWKVEELNHNLKTDLGALGEFEINEKDEVLTKLSADLYVIDQSIELAKEDVAEKASSLDGDITRVIDQAKKDIEVVNKDHEDMVTHTKTTHETFLKYSEERIEATTNSVEITTLDLERSHEVCEKSGEYLNEKKLELNELTIKESQYKDKIQRMEEGKASLLNKLEVEKEKMQGLVSLGACPCCMQHVSAEYVQELREGIEVTIAPIQKDIDILDERIASGNLKVQELNVVGVAVEMQEASTEYDKNLTLVTQCKSLLVTHEQKLKDLHVERESNIQQTENSLLQLHSQHQQKIAKLQSVLDTTESEVKTVMGEVEAKYKQLLESKPQQVENILQQIEDRKLAMSGEHGGKETHLKSVHKLAVENINKQIEILDTQLEKDLQQLVTDKGREVNLQQESLIGAEETLKEEDTAFKSKLQTSELKVSSAEMHLHKLSGKLAGLNMLHDQQQHDIEDWDNLLLTISEKEGKSDVVARFLPKFTKNINKYLHALNLFIDLQVDSTFKLSMNCPERTGQTLNSLSVGQKSRINVAILLALRDVASERCGLECNVLVLDEILSNFSENGTVEVVNMLKERFSDLSLVVISQNKTTYSELFDDVAEYKLSGGFTTKV